MPKIVDIEARRAAIAEACWRVIVRDGIAGVTTRSLAAEAGLGRGLLFHYFRDKDEIILAAFELLAQRFRDRLYPALARVTDPVERLRILAISNMPMDEDQRVEFGVWLSMWAHGYASAPLRHRQRELYHAWRDLMAGTVRDAIAAGQLRPDLDPDKAALQLTAMTDGLIVQILIDPEHPDVARLAVTAVDRLLASWTPDRTGLGGLRTSGSGAR